jgi:hypothetical protein
MGGGVRDGARGFPPVRGRGRANLTLIKAALWFDP